jgi:uncharacterized protein YbaA (DUF1428 family)
MARYVDGFVLPIPKKDAAAYRRMVREAGKIWREHGALGFIECVAADVKPARRMDPAKPPFDGKRMICGGFSLAVDV